MRFQTTFAVLASLVAAVSAAIVADLLNDIAAITTATSSLDQAVVAFPNSGGSTTTAQNIQNSAVALGSLVDRATADAISVPRPISNSDGLSIFAAAHKLQRIVIQTLSDFVSKKPAFGGLPVGGIAGTIKQDLVSLNNSNSKFEAAMISMAPTAAILSDANACKVAVDAALASAISAFS